MPHPNLPLILDLVGWVAAEPRTYHELMEAWRTSCPRLTIWEDAQEAGYLVRDVAGGTPIVKVTPTGLDLLRRERRLATTSLAAE